MNLLALDEKKLKKLGVIEWGYFDDPIPHTFKEFKTWTDKGMEGSLKYLSDHRGDLRSDLRNVFPEFQSGIVFLFGYHKIKKWMLDHDKHSVAAYTLGFEGVDYHFALKEKLQQIAEEFNDPELKVFYSIDAQPVLERDLAFKAGLGWFGKNSMLINKKEGSYFLIASLFFNKKLNLPKKDLDTDHCGQCRACIDACPTLAILDNRTIEANKCISTFTIETFKETDAPKGYEDSRGEVFGCDICQDVCPWNRKPLLRTLGELNLKESLSYLKDIFFHTPVESLQELFQKESNRGVRRKFFGTPFDRPGKEGWLKNLKAFISIQTALSKKRKDEE